MAEKIVEQGTIKKSIENPFYQLLQQDIERTIKKPTNEKRTIPPHACIALTFYQCVDYICGHGVHGWFFFHQHIFSNPFQSFCIYLFQAKEEIKEDLKN